MRNTLIRSSHRNRQKHISTNRQYYTDYLLNPNKEIFKDIISDLNISKSTRPNTGVEISFFCLTGHFCCWCNQIAVRLLQLRVLLVQYVPCFVHLSLEAFPISAIRKCLICRKSTFSHLFIQFFLWKYCHTLPFCSQLPWNPNYIKVDIMAKPTFQEVTQFHRTQTLYKIWSLSTYSLH